MMNKIKRRIMEIIQRAAASTYVWALMGLYGGQDDKKAETKRLIWREVNAIPESIAAHWGYQDREQRVLSERFGRRYDLGMALNEAANRAIEEKKAAKIEADPNGGLVGQQLAALKFQKEYLQRIVKNS